MHIHVEPPSLPMNLSVISVGNGSVILEWNPPRDNGGADITHYQIFINSSEVLRSNVTMATIVLDLEEDHFIQVRAINCAGESDNTSAIFTGIYLLSIKLMLKINNYSIATLTTSGDDLICSMTCYGYPGGDSGTAEMGAITSGTF